MTEKEVKKEHLEKRVDDWKSRISSLYKTIEDWLSNMDGYTVRKQATIDMHEELMQKYSIPSEKIDVLDILYKNQYIATIKPIGLWVIGANGRLDIISKKGSIILVDESEQFTPPHWIAYLPSKKKGGEPFTKDYLASILE